MNRILTIIIIALLFSCSNENNRNQYSDEFFKHFENSEIELRADSLTFPDDAHIEPIRLPSNLKLNKEYIFIDKISGQELKVKRTNYTDISFKIELGDKLTTGHASISPNFYLGTESIGTSEGEFWISQYYVTKSSADCLNIIGIGNQNIAEEEPTDLYAYIYFETNCETKKVKETGELLWLKK